MKIKIFVVVLIALALLAPIVLCAQEGKKTDQEKKGREEWALACDKKDDRVLASTACLFLGSSWYNGEGGPKDLSIARQYFEKACLLDDFMGCYSVATMLVKGEGVPQDLYKARTFFGSTGFCVGTHPALHSRKVSLS